MLKSLDPEQRWEWFSPQAPETVFEYKAYTGVHMIFTEDSIYDDALNNCITKVTNVEVKVKVRDDKGKFVQAPGDDGQLIDTWEKKEFEEFIPADYREVKMSKIFPQLICNAVFSGIWGVSKISKKESGE